MTGDVPSDDSTGRGDADADTDGSDLSTVERAAVEAARSAIQSATPWTGRLLHVGGRPATAAWLTRAGHGVCHLRVDTAATGAPSETTDTFSESSAATASLPDGVTVAEGDRRSLPFETDSFDGACLLGHGLSPIPDQQTRLDAVAELARVVAPEGLVFVTGVGRLAAVSAEFERDPVRVSQSVAAITDDGRVTADRVGPRATGMGSAPLPALPYHAFRLEEFERELVETGLVVNRVVGLDSFLARLDGLDELAGGARQRVVRAAERVATDRAVADGARRLLAVCRVAPERPTPAVGAER